MSEQLNVPRVRMTHPDSGGEYLADPLQVPHLEEAGWQVADGEDDSAVERWPADLRRYEGQPEVELWNPKTGATYRCAESAAPYHREKGWLVVGSDDYLAAQEARYEDKTVEELRELAADRNLKKSGTKDELLARLRGQEQEQDRTDENQDQAGDEPAPSEEG